MSEAENHKAEAPIRKRRVIYIPGYDPFHPRRYRELYRSESAAQAAISGYAITQKPRSGQGPYGWSVEAEIEGVHTSAEVQVLVWSDIVKSSMKPTILATYLDLARTAWAYIGSGALFRLMRLRKGPVIAALYPVLFLLGQLAIACAVAWGLWSALAALIHPYAGPLALAVIPPILMWFRRMDNKVFAYYLMHDYAFSARSKGANLPELEARMADFGAVIFEALQSDAEEVLVVGHSSGAHLGVSILADLFRKGMVPEQGPVLSFLTLGQVIPMVSFLPKAERLRADLHDLCQQSRLTWVDVTAPGDGCAFALCDPVSVTGAAPAEGKLWPLVLSAAFTQTLSPERFRELRWKFFRLHFQYLCAFDRPGDYDYFRITAGPKTLAARLGHRAPSKSRIEAPVSKFTSRKAA
ncbi:hypothetical protein IV417_04335 [Alphaproteobacteria bacterium KMM 3653]|uniref:Uncharacterized protein n=1 Tax=Harenicola maris TaxID=2841044 RepID=A0AAP2CMK7_9RHOB|nr:hypothetical protein [Harenicola maris]